MESMFAPNDLDNEKNQTMKKFRKDIMQRLSKDILITPKYEAAQLYMRTDFLKIHESILHFILNLLEDPLKSEY